MDIERILSQMTVEEKAALVSGTDLMYTNPIPRLGIPSLSMADGPHGLRKQKTSESTEVSKSEPATAFPTAVATASSWNPDNTRRMGEAIAEECRYYGVHTLLGPGVNIKRNPLCGRNFEYFSEDPYLAGMMGAAEVEGVQSKGVGVSVKHFAMNNSENYRFMGNSVASERAMREIYLKPFEIIVKSARPATIMCAYNQINGTFCSENKWLLTDVLREDWGFDGVVMTDWGAVHDRVAGIRAGLDLEMPGDTPICRRWILDAVESGELPMADLDKACRNILRWIDRYVQPAEKTVPDWRAHHALSAEIAADSAVLLKNDGVLPLTGDEKLRVEGGLFEQMRYQGAGSSMINPTVVTTPKDAFDERGIRYDYSLDCCDTILVFAGLTDEYESEGVDRENMRLPDDQLALIDRLCDTEKRVVVVLFGGSPVELPFNDRVSAILYMALPGQNGGTAVAQLLTGEKNPSGKLCETWPLRYEDVPGHETYGKGINEVYREGTEVGYRYYNKHNIPVRYPFGHGLSYTSFSRTEWVRDGDTYTTTVSNTGDRYGAEVVQLYLDGALCGFEKVYLEAGESAEVHFTVEREDHSIYPDTFIEPDEPPRFPVTMESRFTDLRQTAIGRLLYRFVMGVADRRLRDAERLPEGSERDNKIKGAQFMKRIFESNSLRSMTMSSGGMMSYPVAKGFMELTNRHYLRGIRCLLSRVKVPPLPKEQSYDRDKTASR